MPRKPKNDNKKITDAKKNRNDEFYTRLSDVKDECDLYADEFRDKIVYCNCDEFGKSQFINYFWNNYKKLGLKELWATHYSLGEKPKFMRLFGETATHKWVEVKEMETTGSFQSKECLDLLNKCDVVVTNPPFSKLTRFMDMLVKFDKKFLIISSFTCPNYQSIKQKFSNEEVKVGYHVIERFIVPKNYHKIIEWENGKPLAAIQAIWMTNLTPSKYRPHHVVNQQYCPNLHPTYDNHPEIIHIEHYRDIPMNYDGIMSTSISFYRKISYSQYAVLGIHNNLWLNGKMRFIRLLICERQHESKYRQLIPTFNSDLFDGE